MSKLILIVEDERDQREILSELLIDVGYRVVTAATGAQALAAVASESPALVLSDLMLQDMDGRQLLTRMRQLCAEAPPFVFITGVQPSLSDDISSEVLHKPISVENLLMVLDRYCGPPRPTIFDNASL